MKFLVAPALLFLVAAYPLQADAATPAGIAFFEKKIRPVLVSECYECHDAKKQKGGLRLDYRAGWERGGDSGSAIVPGNAAESLLLRTIRHEEPDLEMPQKAPKLSDEVVADFTAWIEMGAPDPRDHAPSPDEPAARLSWAETAAQRAQWWSLQPVQSPPVPEVKNADWSAHPVDRFLLAKLEAKGLSPAANADARAVLRRLSFALTGLPPALEDVQRRDGSPEAYAAYADRQLASPEFGERWARHWMDLVRYAETHGSEGDPEIPQMWRYRDYLIRAFNADVTCDQLIREHLAGDLLSQPRVNAAEKINESMLGTAHLRLVEHGFQPIDTLDDQEKTIENQIDVLGKAFQGLTIACARCHDHKFDAISQRDYYALHGVFGSVRPAQVTIDTPERLAGNRVELTELKARIKGALAEAWLAAATQLPERLKASASAAEQEALRERVGVLEQKLTDHDWATRTRWKTPAPLSLWHFENDARDALGALHGRLEGGAEIRDGRLVLNGTSAVLRTEPLSGNVREKTLEAWVALATLEQGGGGVVTLETNNGSVFDSIVFAERERREWMAGSEFLRRGRRSGGAPEDAAPGELIHIAIAFHANGRIALFRNGQPYGDAYRPDGDAGPVEFMANEARVLLGSRHTGGGKAFLHGEIEEARLYDRALSAEMIAASFKAGPAGALDEAAHDAQRAALAAELVRARGELAAVYARPPDRAWAIALREAEKETGSPLHPWTRMRTGADFSREWKALAQKSAQGGESVPPHWDLAGRDAEKWFSHGAAPLRSSRAGEFAIEPEGERVLTGILPAGVFTHLHSQKQNALFMSPRFKIETDSISVRALGGKGAQVRVIVDNYPLGQNDVFPRAHLARNEPGWIRLDTAYRRGSWAYLEFGTFEDLTRQIAPPPPKGQPKPDRPSDGRSWFGVERVVFHEKGAPPRELPPLLPALFSGEVPRDASELASSYARVLEEAIKSWRDGRLDESQRAFLDYFVRRELLPVKTSELPKVAPLVAQYRALETEIPVPRRAPGVVEADAFDAPFLPRGEHSRPGEPVPRGFLAVLKNESFATSASGRLELAEAITDRRNPLTARVMVNRIWHHLFGRGLVPTVDNFGRLGELPSHPELLDYLAARFVQDGWSFKRMIRFLVTSRAFRMSSEVTAAASSIDPANELISHMRVRRLDAEAIRDAMLSVSGRLDATMFGAPVGEKQPRRSIYLGVRRTNLSPFLSTFDAPKPFTTLGRRDATNVPAQSLTLLNDPFVIELAKQWADSAIRHDIDPAAGASQMFTQALGRPPDAAEQQSMNDYLAELAALHGPQGELQVWQDYAQSLFNLKEFIYVR